jgi:ParB family chromosome partitioning protein
MVLNETITEGHARALLGIKDPESIVAAADIVVKRKLSVRQTEELVRK